MANLLRQCAEEIRELMEIRAKDEEVPLAEVRLTSRQLVEWAKSNKKSAVHQWMKKAGAFDHARAMELAQRILAIRLLRRVTVYMKISEADPTPLRVRMTTSLYTDRQDGGGYRLTEEAAKVPSLRGVMVDTALRELRALKEKYRMVGEIAQAVQAAIDRLQGVPA